MKSDTKPKNKAAERAARRWIAPVECWIDRGGRQEVASTQLAAAVVDAWSAKIALECAQRRYEATTDLVCELLGRPAVVTVPTLCRATLDHCTGVRIEAPPALFDLLGSRYTELVRSEPTAELVALATSADHPIAAALRALLAVDHSETLTLEKHP